MSVQEQNKAIVRRFNKEFIEGGNMQVFNDTVAPDFKNYTAPAGSPKGPEGILYFFNQFLRPAFPGFTVEVIDQVAEGDKVVTRKAFHCTHKGEIFGIPATEKSVVINVIDIIRLREGKYIEHWNVADWQSVIMQLSGK